MCLHYQGVKSWYQMSGLLYILIVFIHTLCAYIQIKKHARFQLPVLFFYNFWRVFKHWEVYHAAFVMSKLFRGKNMLAFFKLRYESSSNSQPNWLVTTLGIIYLVKETSSRWCELPPASAVGVVPGEPTDVVVTEATKSYVVLAWKPPVQRGHEGVMYYIEKVRTNGNPCLSEQKHLSNERPAENRQIFW